VKITAKGIVIKAGSFGPRRYVIGVELPRAPRWAWSLDDALRKADDYRKALAKVQVAVEDVHAGDANRRVDVRK
jgi:hypothetical protein